MHDEFRIHAALPHDRVRDLVKALEAIEPGGEVAEELGRVAVTHDDGDVFIYADSEAAALRAKSEIEEAMSREGISGDVQASRWHPLEERWEDIDAPLPSTPDQLAAEHERLEQAEDEESREAGYPEWEVRVTLPNQHAAREFAEQLESEGIPVKRRWSFVMVGANDEDQAKALAQRLTSEAPAGAKVEVEGTGQPYWDMLHPFAVFGGIAN